MSQLKDVVCGMGVNPKKSHFKSDYKGTIYYFCSKDCKKQFDRSPTQFVGEKK